jgi:hypothetical protein
MKANQHTKAKDSYGGVLRLKNIDESLKEQARDAIQNVESGPGE